MTWRGRSRTHDGREGGEDFGLQGPVVDFLAVNGEQAACVLGRLDPERLHGDHFHARAAQVCGCT